MRTRLKITSLIACLMWAAPLMFSAHEGFPSFIDVAERVGITLINICGGLTKDYIVESLGNGAAFFDYDRDADVDLLIVNGSTLADYKNGGDPVAALYRNDGGRFVNVTGGTGLDRRGWGMGVCVADYDNDGHSDIYITAYGPNVLYRNNGDGTFSDVTAYAGVGDARWGLNCAFGDYDRDGDVDLYVANYLTFDESVIPRRGESQRCRYMGADVFCGPLGLAGEPDVLYRNNGDGTFTDVTERSGIKDPGYYGMGVVFSDFDNDGWPDIYVANDAVPNFLFRNNRDGTFSELGLISGTALNEAGREQSSMGVGAGDYDGNGYFDIFVTNFARDTNTLYRNLGGLLFVDATSTAGMGDVALQYLGWGTGFADFDNDGFEDIFVANGHLYPEIDGLNVGQSYAQRKEIYRNLGGGQFKEIAPDLAGDLLKGKSARGTAFADYDNDGDVDILAVNINDRPTLYRNDGGNRKNWIAFRLEGSRSNRDAIGARIEIHAGGKTQVAEVRSGESYLSHHDMRIHFGLGDATSVDRVRIHWPSGRKEELRKLEAGRFVTVKEGEGVIAQRSGSGITSQNWK
jgi:hypothetical protein